MGKIFTSSISDRCHTSASPLALVWLSCLFVTTGCNRDTETLLNGSDGPSTTGATDEPKLSTTPTPTAKASQESERVVEDAENLAGAQQESRPVLKSRDPIDQLPEGTQYRRAQAALDAGNFAEAANYQKLLQSSIQYSILADAIEALTLVKKRQFEEAISIAERVSAIPAMQAEALVIVGEAKQSQGQWQDATRLMTVATQLNPYSVRAHRWLGAIYYDTGAMQLATDHLRKAAELDPLDYRSLRLASKAHFAYERFEETEIDCQAALKRSPPQEIELELRLRLAESQRELRKFDEALEVLKDMPDSAEVLAARATCWENLGDNEQARVLAERALEDSSKNTAAQLVLARIALAQREWEQAVAILRSVHEQLPYDHEPLFLLGRALVQQGETQEGQQLLQESTELKERFLKFAELNNSAIERPGDLQVRLEIARLAESLGKPKIALAWYRAVLGLDPQNQESMSRLQELQ